VRAFIVRWRSARAAEPPTVRRLEGKSRRGSPLRAKKQSRDLGALLASRNDGPLLGILCEEGPGLRDRLKETLGGCDCDFDLLLESAKAARKTLKRSRRAREGSPEWIDLRITLEHLVYYTARLQLFLSGAVADAYSMALFSPAALRPARNRKPRNGVTVTGMVESWRRLRNRRVAKGDLPAENRLIADAALFAGSANLRCTELLVSLLEGTL